MTHIERHQTWQEAVGIGLGLIAALSPWYMGWLDESAIVAATAAAGSLVVLLSAAKLMALSRLEEYAILLCGVWFCIAPFVLGYVLSGLGILHFVLGGSIVGLSALELWQDWNLTDDQLERYGSP